MGLGTYSPIRARTVQDGVVSLLASVDGHYYSEPTLALLCGIPERDMRHILEPLVSSGELGTMNVGDYVGYNHRRQIPQSTT